MDLDDAACANEILDDCGVPNSDDKFVCRFAVREVESWLLADSENLSRFLSVNATRIPIEPDVLLDPKRSMLNVARSSRKRQIREDMLPNVGSLSEVGPAYNLLLTDFVENYWDIHAASLASPSLHRAITAAGALAERLR
jgi:hypothetical protein